MINWIDFREKQPEKADGFMKMCIVHIHYRYKDQWQEANVYDWFDESKMEWLENDNDIVTHWFYADDIPYPQIN